MELPFSLHEDHKAFTKSNWKKRGMKIDPDDFEYIYNEYIHATNCDLCNKLFTKSSDRHLDHNHTTGDVRNIVCQSCNNKQTDRKKTVSNTGKTYISKRKDTRYTNGCYFRVEIKIDYENILNTARTTLEEAIIVRDEFIANNPQFNLTTADIDA